MAYLSANPNVDSHALSQEVVEEYVGFYANIKTTLIVQLSAIDEAYVPAFADGLNNFADYLAENIYENKGIIAGARGASQLEFVPRTEGSTFYIDVYKFVSLIEKRSHDATVRTLSTTLKQKIDAMVFAEDRTHSQGNLDKKQFGLTMNFPPNMQAYSSRYETYVPCFTTETTWLQFLMTHCRTI